jgi:hypothetical protein
MNIKTISRLHYKNGIMVELCIIYKEGRIPWFMEPKNMDMDKLDKAGVKKVESVLEEPTTETVADDRESRLVYLTVRDKDGKWLVPMPENIKT